MLSVYELSSPNGQLVLTVENGRVLQYSLSLEGRSVIHPSAICMTMQNGNIWGKNGEVVGTSTSSTSEKVYPVAGNYRELTDHYNELSLKFKDGYSVIFRMYNEGMAYRFCGNLPEQDSLIVVDEEASFNLADDPAVILPETTNFTAMTNDKFDVLFGAIDRTNETEFRLLFTPLAQNSMINLIENAKPYGDDFYFVKENCLNYISSIHSQTEDYFIEPSKYSSYSYDESRNKFIEYNCHFLEALYFDLAPLLCIPLYQQYKPVEYIYDILITMLSKVKLLLTLWMEIYLNQKML